MHQDIFKSRERAFEAVYFARVDAELIEEIHKKRERAESRETLSQASGINDDKVLDALIALDVTPTAIESLTHAPLVAVAWANGTVSSEERAAALNAIESSGIEKGSTAHRLFESWLAHPPEPKLMETWRAYTLSIMEKLDTPSREALRKVILGKAENVARASSGILGICAISAYERDVLNQIENVVT